MSKAAPLKPPIAAAQVSVKGRNAKRKAKRFRSRWAGPGQPKRIEKTQTAKVIARRYQAQQLAEQGHSYAQIARALNVSVPTAYYDVQEALGEIDDETKRRAPRLRELQLAQIEAVQRRLWPILRREEVTVTKAVKVKGKTELITVRERPSYGDAIQAGRGILQGVMQASRLLGTEMPVKIAPTDPSGSRPYMGEDDEELRAQWRELMKVAGLPDIDVRALPAASGNGSGNGHVVGAVPSDGTEEGEG